MIERGNNVIPLRYEDEGDEERKRFAALLGPDVASYLANDFPFNVTYGSVYREFVNSGLRPNVAALRDAIRDETRAAYGRSHPAA